MKRFIIRQGEFPIYDLTKHLKFGSCVHTIERQKAFGLKSEPSATAHPGSRKL
jgi:hypothetical protein